jgi:hypothetical protein
MTPAARPCCACAVPPAVTPPVVLVVQSVRDSEWEISEITRTRTNQEQNITLETPYYDIVRIKAEESEEVRRRPSGRGQGGPGWGKAA